MRNRKTRDDDGPPAEADALRRRAEHRLREAGAKPAPLADVDARRLIHELEVHQVELQVQNEELRASRCDAEQTAARFSALYELAPVGYATLGPDGAVRSVNLAGAALLGRAGRPARLVGSRLGAFLPLGGRASFAEFLERAFRATGGAKESCEVTLEIEGQPPVHAHLTATAVTRDGPEILVAMQDVTEIRAVQAARAQAEASNRSRDLFLATLSHELRNPLAPIRNSIYLLQRVPADSAAAARAKEILERQTGHLARLVDDLLEVTRIARNKIELDRKRIDLRELVLQACEDLRSMFDRGGVELRHDLPVEPTWVDADPVRIAQVLGNLLQNAVKFTAAPGTVTVSVTRRDGFAETSVRDSGKGLSRQDMERMFEPFAQADQGLARTQGGLGLGLALVKGLVDLHGGSVRARSEGPGRGSEFTFELPLASAPAAGPAAAGSAVRFVARSIVLIEDNVDTCESLSAALALDGHVVHAAHQGKSGIAMVLALKPDVVLCDIGLPDIDGYEVARTLRTDAALGGVRMIALSGYARPEDEERAREAGFDAHLAKPIDPRDLSEIVAGRGQGH